MFRVLTLLLVFALPLFGKVPSVKRLKIGVCMTAMESYDTDAQLLIESGRRFFCVAQDVTYFVFTCGEGVADAPDVVKIHVDSQGWPFDVLKRVHIYDDHRDLFKEMDYVFALAANMVFVAPVGSEILSDLTVVQHPAFIGKRGNFENKSISAAYVKPNEGLHYYSSRFYGGKRERFFKLLTTLRRQIDTDLARDYMARMYDESHLNRYLIDHPPTKILTPSYCFPVDWHLDLPKKIVYQKKGGR